VEHYLKTKQVGTMLVSETHFTTTLPSKVSGYDVINTMHPADRVGATVIIISGKIYEEMEPVHLDWLRAPLK